MIDLGLTPHVIRVCLVGELCEHLAYDAYVTGKPEGRIIKGHGDDALSKRINAVLTDDLGDIPSEANLKNVYCELQSLLTTSAKIIHIQLDSDLYKNMLKATKYKSADHAREVLVNRMNSKAHNSGKLRALPLIEN